MTPSEAGPRSKRNWWAVGAFALLATTLIGMKCLCLDPAATLRQQVTGSAEVRGEPLRAVPEVRGEPIRAARAASGQAPVSSDAAPEVATIPSPAAFAPEESAPEAQATAPESSSGTISPPPTLVVVKNPSVPSSAVSAASTEIAPPNSESRPAGASETVQAVPQPTAESAQPKSSAAGTPQTLACKTVTWDDISKYSYVPQQPDDDATSPAAQASEKPKSDQIPDDVRAMSGTRMTIDGYAVPLEFEKGTVTKFIMLSAPLACCFAEAPPMNRWMTVVNAGKNEFDYGRYSVLRVSGTFDVGEETREGYVVGIYRLKADKIVNVDE